MSITLDYELFGIVRVQDGIARLHRVDYRDLVEQLTATVESQTRRRLQDEKTAPDGSPWADWSAGYAESRHGGNSLLQGEGDLLDSITALVSGMSGEVGSNLVYAGIHQKGGTIKAKSSAGLRFKMGDRFVKTDAVEIPQRQWLGISADNGRELEAVAVDYLEALLP